MNVRSRRRPRTTASASSRSRASRPFRRKRPRSSSARPCLMSPAALTAAPTATALPTRNCPSGVQLDVTPFINPDGLVVMQIDEEIDDINGSTSIQGVGNVPNTDKRTLSSDVAVKDRDTIILGGAIYSTKAIEQKRRAHLAGHSAARCSVQCAIQRQNPRRTAGADAPDGFENTRTGGRPGQERRSDVCRASPMPKPRTTKTNLNRFRPRKDWNKSRRNVTQKRKPNRRPGTKSMASMSPTHRQPDAGRNSVGTATVSKTNNPATGLY